MVLAKSPIPRPAIRLSVTDRDSIVIGFIEARVGLRTWAGPITRLTDKSIWVETKDGREQMFRVYDGRLPSVPQRFARGFTPKS